MKMIRFTLHVVRSRPHSNGAPMGGPHKNGPFKNGLHKNGTVIPSVRTAKPTTRFPVLYEAHLG